MHSSATKLLTVVSQSCWVSQPVYCTRTYCFWSGGERLQCEVATCWTVMDLLCHPAAWYCAKFKQASKGLIGLDWMTDEVLHFWHVCRFLMFLLFPLPLSISQTQWIWVPRMSWWIFRRWMKGFGQVARGLTWPHPPSLSATVSRHWTWGPKPWRSVGLAGGPARTRTRRRALWCQAGPPARTQSCLLSG